jgi:hypothetical protein
MCNRKSAPPALPPSRGRATKIRKSFSATVRSGRGSGRRGKRLFRRSPLKTSETAWEKRHDDSEASRRADRAKSCFIGLRNHGRRVLDFMKAGFLSDVTAELKADPYFASVAKA